MEVLVLTLLLLGSLFMIPVGLPGLWVMLAAAGGYSLLVPNSIGMSTLIGTTALALAEGGLIRPAMVKVALPAGSEASGEEAPAERPAGEGTGGVE